MSESVAGAAAAPSTLADVSLYARLGGHDKIQAIVASIWENHISNPLIKQRYVNSDPVNVKRLVTELCCQGFGGPETYTGKDMLSSHTGMNINEAEFIAVCDDVLSALDKHRVGQHEKDEILCILYSMKADIVHR